jgi:hypothetical protein
LIQCLGVDSSLMAYNALVMPIAAA